MKAKENKISPYPILYSSSVHSGYDDTASFSGIVSAQNNIKDGLVELYISYSLKNDALHSLIKARNAAMYINVECSKTYFRLSKKVYSLTEKISVPYTRVSSGIEVFVGIIAENDISNLSSDAFSGIYKNKQFDIAKGQLLAADSEWEIPIEGIGDFSIPILVRKSETECEDFKTLAGDILTITLNAKTYELYKNLSNRFLYSSVFIILIPAIAAALRELIHESRSQNQRLDVSERRWTSTIDRIMKKKYPAWDINECEIYDSKDERFLESQLRIAWGGINLPFEKELEPTLSKESDE